MFFVGSGSESAAHTEEEDDENYVELMNEEQIHRRQTKIKKNKSEKIKHGGRIFANCDTKPRFSEFSSTNFGLFSMFTKIVFFDFAGEQN